jgi:hypothetical protein
VRVNDRDDERVTGNLAWAEFIHFTARPVNGIPDPHLHAHCFTFNATFDEKEQRVKAVQFRDIKRDAPYYEAAFYSRLGKRLTELGYPIERKGKKWDLASIPKSMTKKFSRRTEQIEKHAEEKGVRNAKEKDKLGALTREGKEKEFSMTELRAIWREWLSDDEQAALANLASGVQRGPAEISPDAPQAAMRHAISHCFERNSVVPSRQLLAEALRRGVGEVSIEEVKRELVDQGVMVGNWAGREMATTQAVLSEEQSMLAFARNGKRKAEPLNPSWKIKREWLNAGQKAAVRHVTQSRDRVLVIKGMAGTGKTSLMQEAVEAIQAEGHKVFTFAPSAEASRDVLRSEGFANATTVAELLVNEELQKSARGHVLWIDEAGLLGTRQLNRVFDIADRLDARVILSGDWRQHGSVERGAAMRLLEQEGGIKPAIVSDIQRQKGQYRKGVAMLAEGDTERGFDLLDDLGWIKAIDDELRPLAVAQEYAKTVEEGGSGPLVISPTHAEGERITQAIRQELKSRKLLGAKDRSFLRLAPLNRTEAERADPAMYEPGDVIVFHQNAKGHRKGERITVGDAAPAELLKHAERFQVYRQSELPLAKGDRIRFTSIGDTKDRKHRLNNGAMYRIAGFTSNGDIRLDNGWIVDQQHGFIAPGYVVTSHASQGKTVGKVIIAESAESFAAASQEQFYVSVSRGKHEAVIFTDDKEALKEAVTKTTPRIAATELLAPPKPAMEKLRESVNRARESKTRVRQREIALPEYGTYGRK